ncbi:MAG TPA: sulfite exporter TauE/SafE family protein [Methanospirillum sp.]|nr:sulfite exporter TauE/SafE family protein [Methanospirillum sp.]
MIALSDLLLAGFFSLLIGIISAILGLGGGFLLVPMYTLVFSLDPALAIGTSITTTIFTAGSATVYHARERSIQYPLVKVLILGSIPAAFIGSYLTVFLSGEVLNGIFGLFLLVIALQMAGFIPDKAAPSCRLSELKNYDHPEDPIWSNPNGRRYFLFWGSLGGLISGLTGISAGTVFIPALFRWGIRLKNAVPISLATIIFTSVGAALASLLLGHISYPFLLFSAGGVTLGALIGVRISRGLDQALVRYGFSLTLMAIAVLMLKKAVLF